MTKAPLHQRLTQHWWPQPPTPLARALRPLAAVYGALARRQRARTRVEPLPVPVLVVGNLVAGGAGKTPTVIAMVQALQAAGWQPGVISRGYGRRAGADDTPLAVDARSAASQVGDEPLLISRRCTVPVVVARSRVEAARALLRAHPGVDLLVSDDGLQHHALPRQAEVLVFDERGAGNGLLLPAGPLREPLPAALRPGQWLLYTAGHASTPLPGGLAGRRAGAALPLRAWWAGERDAAVPLARLAAQATAAGERWLAVAGLAAPEKFFALLEAAGLPLQRCPQPDHASLDPLPWPAARTAPVIVTEKDAVKLGPERIGPTPVWVLPLDLTLPGPWWSSLHEHLLTLRPAPPLHAPDPPAAPSLPLAPPAR